MSVTPTVPAQAFSNCPVSATPAIPAQALPNNPRSLVNVNGASVGVVVVVGSGGGYFASFTVASPLLFAECFVRDAPPVVGCAGSPTVCVPDPVLDLDALAAVVDAQVNGDSSHTGGAPDDPPATANALPRPSFARNRSFARVARSTAHPSKGVRPLPCAKTSTIVVCGQEVVENINFYQHSALVYRFVGFWPSLPNLHHCVSNSWKPLVAYGIELFPCAKGFFIASFTSTLDCDLVMGKLWSWGDHSLSIKPWSPSFNPFTESLSIRPAWVRLPNLPLHLWEPSCFEAIGNSIGNFLKVDDATTSMGHSTFARLFD